MTTTIATTQLLKTKYSNVASCMKLQLVAGGSEVEIISCDCVVVDDECGRHFRHVPWPDRLQPCRSSPAHLSHVPPGTGHMTCRTSERSSRRPTNRRCSWTGGCRCGRNTDSRGWSGDRRWRATSGRSMSDPSSRPLCPPCSMDRRTWWCTQKSCRNSRTDHAERIALYLHIHNNYLYCNYGRLPVIVMVHCDNSDLFTTWIALFSVFSERYVICCASEITFPSVCLSACNALELPVNWGYYTQSIC